MLLAEVSSIPAWAVALIAAFSAAIMASIPRWFDRKQKKDDAEQARSNKLEDWARQDEVSKRVEEAAILLKASNEKVAVSTGEVNKKLDVIHDLVNSKMTESMQNELDSELRSLVWIKEIAELKRKSGEEPSENAAGLITALEKRIVELQARMRDRKQQQETIDKKNSLV